MPPLSLNEHQRRIIGYMIEFIIHYQSGEMSFSQLVGNLDGSLLAGEFKDEEFIKKWYEVWGPLEEFNAVYGDNVREDDADKFIIAMKSFLRQILS